LFGIRNSIPRGVAVIASSLGLAATALFTTQAQSADIHATDDSTGQAARAAMLAAQDVWVTSARRLPAPMSAATR
jgi:hypothetical protein